MTKSERIMNSVNSIGGGRIASISYKSSVPVNASSKKSGIRIEKVTSKKVRIGVKYENIKGVVKSETERKNNYSWVTPNRIAFNSNTNKHYVRITRLSGRYNKSKSSYILMMADGTRREISKEELMNYVIPSYFNKNGEIPEVQNISIENVIRINNENFD